MTRPRGLSRTRGGAVMIGVVGLVGLVAAGCAMLGPASLEVLPGQRVVLGRIDLAFLAASEIVVDVVRVDGGYATQFYVGHGAQGFALALPPGRYLIPSIRIASQRAPLPQEPTRSISVTFDVGDAPAVYIGTLRLTSGLGTRVETTVIDEYASTVPALRRHYANIPAEVARALMRPA